MAKHEDVSLGSRHALHNWEYATTIARTGASGFVAGDVGKIARQTDNDTYWVLIATTPTWLAMSSPDVKDTWEFLEEFTEALDTGRWTTTVSGTGSAVTVLGSDSADEYYGGQLLLRAGGANQRYGKLEGDYYMVKPDGTTTLKFRMKWDNRQVARVFLGMSHPVSLTGARFRYDSETNWVCDTLNTVTGTTTTVISGGEDTDWHEWEIRLTASNCKFYLDGTLKATHTTDLPDTSIGLRLRALIINEGDALTHDAILDYIRVRGTR